MLMHATIQKPLEEILSFFKKGEKVFITGCSNCAAKCHSGGEEETKFMAERLKRQGVGITGWASPPNGGSLCKLSIAEKMLNEDLKEAVQKADSFLPHHQGNAFGKTPLSLYIGPIIQYLRKIDMS